MEFFQEKYNEISTVLYTLIPTLLGYFVYSPVSVSDTETRSIHQVTYLVILIYLTGRYVSDTVRIRRVVIVFFSLRCLDASPKLKKKHSTQAMRTRGWASKIMRANHEALNGLLYGL